MITSNLFVAKNSLRSQSALFVGWLILSVSLNANMSEKTPEVYKYDAAWPVYGMNWSRRKSDPFRLAIGSFIEEYRNKVTSSTLLVTLA